MAGKWLRKIGAGVAAYVLGLVLLAASSATVFHFTVANPGKIKSILNDSGVYGSLVDTLADSAAKDTKQPDSAIPLGDPKIQKAIKKAFPPKVLRSNTEELIDGTYGWLQGKTKKVEFTLDFTESRNILAREVGNYARSYTAKLPPCGFQATTTATANTFDLKCLPPGATPAQIGAKTAKDLKSDEGFLSKPKLTPKNLFSQDAAGNPFESQSLPSQFQLMSNMLWILLGVVVLLAAIAILLSENRLKGIGKVAKSFLAVGILTAITPLLLNFFSSRVAGSGLLANPASKDIALPIIQSFINAVSTVYYIFGAVCILIGIAGFIFAHRSKSGGAIIQNHPEK